MTRRTLLVPGAVREAPSGVPGLVEEEGDSPLDDRATGRRDLATLGNSEGSEGTLPASEFSTAAFYLCDSGQTTQPLCAS